NRATPVAVAVPHAADVRDLSQRAVFAHIHNFSNDGIEAVLMTNLKYQRRMSFRCADHLVAVRNRIPHGLFDKDVFARVECSNGDFCVQMKWRGDYDCVDIFGLDELSIIGVSPGLAAGKIHAFAQVRFKDVAHAGNSGVWNRGEISDQRASLSSRSNNSYTDAINCRS